MHDDDEVLADGQVGRVPLLMRDADPLANFKFDRQPWQDRADEHFNRPVRITGADGDSASLHRPGFRLAHGRAADAARERVVQSYKLYDQEIQLAFRTPPHLIGDVDLQGRRAGGSMVATMVRDAKETHQQFMSRLHSALDYQLQNAWRGRPR